MEIFKTKFNPRIFFSFIKKSYQRKQKKFNHLLSSLHKVSEQLANSTNSQIQLIY